MGEHRRKADGRRVFSTDFKRAIPSDRTRPGMGAGSLSTQIMVQRYAHLSPDHIRAAAERLVHRTSPGATGTKTDPDGTGGNGEDAEAPEKIGAPGGNRTPDPRLRRPMLYPTELRAPNHSRYTIPGQARS